MSENSHLSKGQRFYNIKDVNNTIENLEKVLNCEITRGNTKKLNGNDDELKERLYYEYVIFQCPKSGFPDSKVEEKNRKRKRESAKTNCPFQIHLKLASKRKAKGESQYLYVESWSFEHKHDPITTNDPGTSNESQTKKKRMRKNRQTSANQMSGTVNRQPGISKDPSRSTVADDSENEFDLGIKLVKDKKSSLQNEQASPDVEFESALQAVEKIVLSRTERGECLKKLENLLLFFKNNDYPNESNRINNIGSLNKSANDKNSRAAINEKSPAETGDIPEKVDIIPIQTKILSVDANSSGNKNHSDLPHNYEFSDNTDMHLNAKNPAGSEIGYEMKTDEIRDSKKIDKAEASTVGNILQALGTHCVISKIVKETTPLSIIDDPASTNNENINVVILNNSSGNGENMAEKNSITSAHIEKPQFDGNNSGNKNHSDLVSNDQLSDAIVMHLNVKNPAGNEIGDRIIEESPAGTGDIPAKFDTIPTQVQILLADANSSDNKNHSDLPDNYEFSDNTDIQLNANNPVDGEIVNQAKTTDDHTDTNLISISNELELEKSGIVDEGNKKSETDNVHQKTMPVEFALLPQAEQEFRILLSIFNDEEYVQRVDKRNKIKKSDVTKLTYIDLKDPIVSCDLDPVKQYFTSHAFTYLKEVIQVKIDSHVWTCEACKKSIVEQCVCCDQCLYWFEWSCAGINENPTENWFCKNCIDKNN
ncbi:hypothetical protein KQX54_013041 [Cotesia glomerata]|uniref:Zinc finger PHD-type domain-containing protein n=2 Tax=Cotesia glomerata TaxID=32391 RepID=A0AAV7IBM8_COTGL|nr:hypothetical protein KQX54_013041 [Cotesia glomerata]